MHAAGELSTWLQIRLTISETYKRGCEPNRGLIRNVLYRFASSHCPRHTFIKTKFSSLQHHREYLVLDGFRSEFDTMPLPRPKRQRVARKPESLRSASFTKKLFYKRNLTASYRSQSTGRSLPPPDHPICDILRLSGRLSCTPVELDGALERIWGKREDETTLAVRERMGLPYTPLEELDRAVKSYFSDGLLVASTKFATLQQSILRGESTIILGENLRLLETYAAERLPWNSCKLATTLVLLFASPRESEAMHMALK